MKAGPTETGANGLPHDSTLVLLPFCLAEADQLRAALAQRGVNVEIISDERGLRSTLEARKPSFVVGVCCQKELTELQPLLAEAPFAYRAVLLSGDDCVKITAEQSHVDFKPFLEHVLEQLPQDE